MYEYNVLLQLLSFECAFSTRPTERVYIVAIVSARLSIKPASYLQDNLLLYMNDTYTNH